MIGARGSVAVTATVGALALRAGLVPPTGCVTELPPLRAAGLPGWADLVLGGHDVVATPVPKKAVELAAAGVLPARLAAALADELAAHDDELRPLPSAATQAGAAALIARLPALGQAAAPARRPYAGNDARPARRSSSPCWRRCSRCGTST